MKFKILIIVLLFASCKNENVKENEEKKTKVVDNSIEEKKDILPFSDLLAEQEPTQTFEISLNDKSEMVIQFSNALGSEEISFNADNLVAKISSLCSNNAYHQNLSVYLSEKQVKKISLVPENNINISQYEIINPSHSPYWHLNGYLNNELKLSIAFLVPENIYGAIFSKVNQVDFNNFKNALFLIPPSNKIEYNSLRKLGKFNEGILGVFNEYEFPKNKSLVQNYLFKKNEVLTLDYFFNQDYTLPGYNEFGALDTSLKLNQSLRELFYVKAFSYKSSYSLTNPQDSALEIQIDFKTKDNQPTIRFVMGGVIQNKIPYLESNDLYNGLYLPLGFKSYEETNNSFDSYILMGNTSGQWVDNYNGLSIDGVMLYFDKNNKSKIHIWLMSADGNLPVAHYGTNLNIPR